MFKRIGILLVTTALVACGSGADFRLDIVFPADGDPLSFTESLRVTSIEASDGTGCIHLLEGNAEPGDAGYGIETEKNVAPGEEEVFLEQVGPGRRIFFVQAIGESGAVILHGCADVEAGGGGPQEVRIDMQYIDVGQ